MCTRPYAGVLTSRPRPYTGIITPGDVYCEFFVRDGAPLFSANALRPGLPSSRGECRRHFLRDEGRPEFSSCDEGWFDSEFLDAGTAFPQRRLDVVRLSQPAATGCFEAGDREEPRADGKLLPEGCGAATVQGPRLSAFEL